MLWGLDAFLSVGGATILLGNFGAFFVVNSFTVLLWNLEMKWNYHLIALIKQSNLSTFLGIAGAALLIISAFVFVDCLIEGSK